MRRRLGLIVGILLMGGLGLPAAAVPASAAGGDGKGDEGFTISDPRITESSGLAASRQHPGIYWTHNDQDTGAYLYAVDSATGRTVARITMTGVGTPRDVEAISMGPDNQIWVGDIGDNDGVTWPYVWIYKLPEPKELKDQSVKATQYVVKYTDGSRDAESMVVHPGTGRVYIIDKQENGGHLYAGPATLSPKGTNVFKPVKAVDLWATDAAFSPDGERLVVRGYFGGIWYDWNGGDLEKKGRISVPLGQGESVSYSPDGTKILLGMEGADSEVEAQDAPGGGGSDAPSGSGSSAASGSDGGGNSDGTIKIGALALGAVAALFGLRRLFRRP
ncbi:MULTISPECIES: WD40 repeat domain-containing protein [unclassified Streptomyces]|uniref:WD40 repeat domain-containing protein n=1 Tax=unclassified Streptomyces TaxID=2593676 RepID=UPI002476B360|nr:MULTISPECIES: WD40 repeat domain-containing protein [unclassified Streptomyces]MDH6450980.1 MYXO-CTERM domain-containing protein [Streptomyces sp. SAI-119]MDH6498467.1 MYXO-CTERM domain-containing protein [Streptomyces sp. SAI-149]